jgi:hypothetical protein
MRDAVSVPVTVKHRIGLDAGEDYAFVRDFVGMSAGAITPSFLAPVNRLDFGRSDTAKRLLENRGRVAALQHILDRGGRIRHPAVTA